MLNRTLQGFPPASTFKIVTTIAGLESGKFQASSTLPTSASCCFDGQCYIDHAAHGSIGFPLPWRSAATASTTGLGWR